MYDCKQSSIFNLFHSAAWFLDISWGVIVKISFFSNATVGYCVTLIS